MGTSLVFRRKYILFVLVLTLFCSALAYAAPQDTAAASNIDYVQGTVVDVQAMEQTQKWQGIKNMQVITVLLTSGPEKGQNVQTVNYEMNRPGFSLTPEVGDKVVLAVSQNSSQKQYNIADYDRLPYVYLLLGMFVVALLAIGGRVGIKSLFVVGFAIFIILQGMIPLILKYHFNLIMITVLISAIIAIITQVTTVSGWNPKTWGAILGTVGGVIVAGVLASVAIGMMHLTGLDNEEAIMLKVTYLASVDFQEVLFAGIVLGSLGAVMDVSISIASAQYEVKASCPQFGYKELFKSGIRVGQDVMGTMSNTLILAYLGSSLPLVLLLSAQNNLPILRIMNLNLIVTEIVRAITGSIGLICAIPLTALITAFLLSIRKTTTIQKQI